MFAYCNNNPVNRLDSHGEIWNPFDGIQDFLDDVYALLRDDEEKVEAVYNSDTDTVQIRNSSNIKTTFIMLAYSFYTNHVNENTKDNISGTTAGLFYEWELHTLGYHALNAVSNGLAIFGINNATINSYRDSCYAVDVGNTVFSDQNHGIMSTGMHILYILLFPFSAEHDLFMEGMGEMRWEK